MAKAQAQVGPNLVVKVQSLKGTQNERTIGFCDGITFSVQQGQRMIFCVDSPFPYEINQGASPSFVRGTMSLYLPKGTSLEAAGLVPYRLNQSGDNYLTESSPMVVKIYERNTTALVYQIDGMKVNSYTVSIIAKKVVKVQVQFEAKYLTPGRSTNVIKGESLW